MNQHSCQNQFLFLDPSIQKNARKAFLVLVITTVTMILEIYFGYVTGSMALLADGWHMATHAAALGITYLTYRLATHPDLVKNFNFGGGKIIALGGFASSVFLICVVAMIAFESVSRLLHPREIHFTEALTIAVIGLLVNIICAWILRDHHHDHAHEHDHTHEHHHHDHSHTHHDDHNIRGAYIHVLADALTSVGAIVALLGGRYANLGWLDPVIGLVGAVVIFKWAIGLIRDTGWELLDGHAKGVDFDKLQTRLQSLNITIVDLHVWKIAPKVMTAELVLSAKGSAPNSPSGTDISAKSRQILESEFNIRHSVIEIR
jgi:cation diffusion facilitator family transporter